MPYFTHDGHQLYYIQQGNGALLLILPGNTASSAHHAAELAFFGQHFRAVALDFWGTGCSERLAVWPDTWFEQAARDTAGLIQYLGQRRSHLLGVSGGAVVALLAAILFPEVIQSVIADSVADCWYPDEIERAVQGRDVRDPQAVSWWKQAHGKDWEQVVRADSHLLQRLARQGSDWSGGRLHQIRCPVLFTASLGDDLVAEIGPCTLRMAEQVAGSQVFFMQEGGHPLVWSRPEVFRRVALDFLIHVEEV